MSGSVREVLDELGVLIRAAGASETNLATLRSAFDQMYAELRDEGIEDRPAVALATTMLLLSVMENDPTQTLADALAVSTGSRPKQPLIVLATILETLK